MGHALPKAVWDGQNAKRERDERDARTIFGELRQAINDIAEIPLNNTFGSLVDRFGYRETVKDSGTRLRDSKILRGVKVIEELIAEYGLAKTAEWIKVRADNVVGENGVLEGLKKFNHLLAASKGIHRFLAIGSLNERREAYSSFSRAGHNVVDPERWNSGFWCWLSYSMPMVPREISDTIAVELPAEAKRIKMLIEMPEGVTLKHKPLAPGQARPV